MIMEPSVERACTALRRGSPAPRTLLHIPSVPQQGREPGRIPHLLQPQACLGAFVPVLVAPRAGAAQALGSGLPEPLKALRSLSQFPPVPPHWFASMSRVGAHTELSTAGRDRAEEHEPSRDEQGTRTGPCPCSGLCPASHVSLVTSALASGPEMPSQTGRASAHLELRTSPQVRLAAPCCLLQRD